MHTVPILCVWRLILHWSSDSLVLLFLDFKRLFLLWVLFCVLYHERGTVIPIWSEQSRGQKLVISYFVLMSNHDPECMFWQYVKLFYHYVSETIIRWNNEAVFSVILFGCSINCVKSNEFRNSANFEWAYSLVTIIEIIKN